MKTAMYIVKETNFDGEWYQLRLTTNHFTLSCGPNLDTILNCARNYVLRYGKKHLLERAVNNLTYKWKYSEAEHIRREQEYSNRNSSIDQMLQEVVSLALIEVRQNTPMKKVKNRLKITRHSGTEITVKEEPPVTLTKVSTPKVIKKRRLLRV